MDRFRGKKALVTGGSSGIGRAIAAALAAEGAQLVIAARTPGPLDAAAREMGGTAIVADLSTADAARQLADQAVATLGGLDILVLSSGRYLSGQVQDLGGDEFGQLLDSNLFGPAALVQALISELVKAQGDVLFINSSVTRAANLAGRAYFAAGNHALKAFADGLRDDLNDHGVRVTSLFPGTTATPRQARLHAAADTPYQPDRILQADDVAAMALSALALPATAEITDLYVRPRYKS